MMKKVTIFMLSLAMTAAMLSGCSSSNDSSSSSTAETTTAAETTVADETTETEAAEETSQEETVDEEENYDTGDASLDNIRNQDEIGEQELLVHSQTFLFAVVLLPTLLLTMSTSGTMF